MKILFYSTFQLELPFSNLSFWRNFMKFVSFLTFALMMTLPSVFAAPTEFRLGLVDFQRALNSVDEGKSAKTQLEKEGAGLKDREEKINKMATEIRDLKAKEASNVLKPTDITRLRKLEEDAQKEIIEHQKAGEKIGEKQRAKTGEILHKLQTISEEVGRAGNYTLVLEKSMGALVYAASATDFTEEVIQRYNKQFKGGSAKEEKK